MEGLIWAPGLPRAPSWLGQLTGLHVRWDDRGGWGSQVTATTVAWRRSAFTATGEKSGHSIVKQHTFYINKK